MELRNTTVVMLGGSGLVGHAVARRLLEKAPQRLVLVALFEDEVREAARALEPFRGACVIEVDWGNVFLPAPGGGDRTRCAVPGDRRGSRRSRWAC